MSLAHRRVFITGSTGYLGSALGVALLARGHHVDALCRAGSEKRLTPGVSAVIGDPLDASSYARALRPDHVVVHLVGTPKPAPWKGESFDRVDFGSVQQLVRATSAAPVAHIVYVSVAHPAPVMRAYVSARQRAEALLDSTATPHTFVRPWYVVGPGHRWPAALAPFYWLAALMPSPRAGAERLGLVSLEQMVATLVDAVETVGMLNRTYDVPQIRAIRMAS
ncbi:MAG: NAD(P)H-binding protein [bacterium]